MTTCIQVITTVSSQEQAQQLATLITSRRLAACAQIAGPIRSTYWWNDQLETAEEWQLVLKTSERAYGELESLLRERHPYEVPEIIVVPMIGGFSGYLEWIEKEVRPGSVA